MRLHTPLSILGITAVLALILGATVIAAPVSPPPGGYTGGIFSFYFKRIIEGDGTVGTTSGGVCPAGRVITGFSTAPSTYGLPICTAVADSAAGSLTGSLRGTINYVPKYGLTNTGIINSQIFDNGTNIGIGNVAPGVKLDITGGIGNTQGGVNYYRNVAHTNSGVASVVGTMKITLPKSWSNTMMKVKIEGYNYTGGARGTSWTAEVGGYNNTTGPSWINYYGRVFGNAPFNSIRLGHDGTNNVILLGGVSTTWSFPKVVITDVMLGHQNLTNWGTGWTIGWITDESAITSIVTPNIDMIQNLGNLGVGTVSPVTKLDVAGGIRALGGSLFTGVGGYTFSSPGDTDGGMFSPADGTVVFATNNTERVRITSTGAVGIGTTTPGATLDVNGDARINGLTVGRGSGSVGFNTAIGINALNSNGTGNTNTAIGSNALRFNTTGSWNTAVGYAALNDNTTGFNNIGMGASSMTDNTTGYGNSAFGMNTLRWNTTGNSNTAIGFEALSNNATGSQNVAIGTTAGSSLIYGNGNIFIGNNVQPNIGTGASNQLNIGNWIYGNTGNIGIGDSTPSYRLDVAGTGAFYGLRVTSGAVNNYVLTSDASGNARWMVAQSANGGISSGTLALSGPLVGTQNYIPKYSAAGTGIINSQIFDNGTNVGIGTALPGAKLEVVGQIKITGGSPAIGRVLTTDATGLASWQAVAYSESDPQIGALTLNYTPKWNGSSLVNGLIYDNGISIGIGTSAPSVAAKLDVLGKVKIADGNQGTGKILTSDGDGLATWMDAPGDLPIGTVMAFNSMSCPAGWAVADGNSGTPDLRGEFVRGLDSGRGIDTGRILGSAQAQSMQSHTHAGNSAAGGAFTPTGSTTAGGGTAAVAVGTSSDSHSHGGSASSAGSHAHGITAVSAGGGGSNKLSNYNNIGHTDETSTAAGGAHTHSLSINNDSHAHSLTVPAEADHTHPLAMNPVAAHSHALTIDATGGAETRPRNVALLYCMKITAAPASLSNSTTWMNIDGTATGRIVLATTGNVGIGTSTPGQKLDVVGNIRTTGQFISTLATGTAPLVVASTTLNTNLNADLLDGQDGSYFAPASTTVTIGTTQTITGSKTFNSDITVNGVGLGRGNGSLSNNTRLGQNSLQSITTGNFNTAIGQSSLDVTTLGASNTALGYDSLGANISGNNNTAIGLNALNTISNASSNTAIGWNAGSNLVGGDNNIAIGANTAFPSTSSSNQLNIGNWIYGSAGNIGIGTTTPVTKLDVIGAVKITDGSQGSGKVLTSDANGIAQWRDPEQSLPLGSVMSFNGTACPAGWVMADGTNGTPDLRGEFVRGLDSGRGVDSGRVLGSFQDNAIEEGSFIVNRLGNAGSTVTIFGTVTGSMMHTPNATTVGPGQNFGFLTAAAQLKDKITIGSGTETRPRNVALLYCIKISTGPGATASLSTSNTGTWMNLDDTSTGRVVLATTGNVGVGTMTPAAKFDLVGTMKVTDGTQGVGKVLTSDANGVATWQDPEGSLPIGTIMTFNGNTCPAGWVIADGTSGTPDLRGEFVRGLDSGRGIDVGRTLGSQQRGSLVMNASTYADTRVFSLRANGNNSVAHFYDTAQPLATHTYAWNNVSGTQGSWGIGTVDGNFVGATRPRNVALLYCMKISAAPPSMSDSTTWMNLDGTSTGRVTLATTGKVGIGTATPSVKLEVGSTSGGEGSMLLNRETTGGNEGGQIAFAPGTNGDDTFTIDSYNAGASQILRLRSTSVSNLLSLQKNGNIGMGTDTPLYKLDVRGQMKIDQSASYDVWIQGGDSAGTETRNLALLGHKATDTLYLNYGGEYVGGTQVGGNLYAGAFYYNSDIKLKTNIKKIDSSLEKILKLNGYSFDWKKDGKHDIGVIAQEVEKVFPELVGDKLEEDGSTTKTVQYGNLVAPIIEAIKELASQVKSLHTLIEEQQSDIRKLQSENADLRSRLDAIEARLAQ